MEKEVGRNDLGKFSVRPYDNHWSDIAVYCFKRGCNCQDCPNYDVVMGLESSDICNVKASVLELVRLFGKPKVINKRQMRVRCVETGKVFNSISEAAFIHKCTRSWLMITMQKGKPCRGYHFERVKEQEK